MSVWAWAAVGVAAGRAGFAWSQSRAQMVPDFALYVHGGPRLYPSPLGTTAGWLLGADGLALLNVAAAAAVVWLVARQSGSAWAAWAAVLLPIGFISAFAGVDAIGAALLLAGFRWERWRLPFHAAASLVHLALVPLVVVAVAVRRRWWAAAGVAAIGLGAGLLTPYSGILDGSLPSIIGWACINAAVLAPQLAPVAWRWRRADRTALLLGLALLAASLGEAGAQQHRQLRYAYPAVLYLLGWAWRSRHGERAHARRRPGTGRIEEVRVAA